MSARFFTKPVFMQSSEKRACVRTEHNNVLHTTSGFEVSEYPTDEQVNHPLSLLPLIKENDGKAEYLFMYATLRGMNVDTYIYYLVSVYTMSIGTKYIAAPRPTDNAVTEMINDLLQDNV